jgi:alpha-beta hydrolase superfamily lysophospholipase
MVQSEVTFPSLDGTLLAATLVHPAGASRSVVLVHGGGVTRDEAGFFVRLADGLAAAGIASLRFDLRGHGRSGGRQRDLTLAAVANDIRAATDDVRRVTGHAEVALIGTSFSGGICALMAAGDAPPSLVLLNPLLDYKRRFVDEKPYWHDDRLDPAAVSELDAVGFVPHSPTFKLGRALLNEVFHLPVRAALSRVTAPTLIVHGTKDTFINIESSRVAVDQLAGECTLIEIDGAQHGFAVPNDPEYLDPQTLSWQELVIDAAVDWITGH